jgi:hypothetical protein
MQTILHYSLHLLFPALIARLFFKDKWKKVYLIFLATMLIDLDHLLATPIFDPHRCSIGLHFFHSFYAIAIYIILLFFKKTRIIAIGLLFHIFTDSIDCILTFCTCKECYENSAVVRQLSILKLHGFLSLN